MRARCLGTEPNGLVVSNLNPVSAVGVASGAVDTLERRGRVEPVENE